MVRHVSRRAIQGVLLTAVILLSDAPVHAVPARHGGRVVVTYVQPSDPAHREIYRTLRRQRVLERLGAVVRLVRLPGRLTLRLKGCGGEANAWYDPESHAVTMCYEMVAGIIALAPHEASAAGVTQEQAIRGPIAQILVHETGHALFHLLRVPIFGREEDAADQLAALLLLHLAPAQARALVGGSGYFFVTLGRQEAVDRSGFANVHGLSWQRFYSLVCLAYGSDPRRYADIVAKDYLPPERAATCREEYKSAAYAFERLIGPHLRVRLHRGARLRRAWQSRVP
ncbi:Putative metallopeptidase [Methylobacterium sp. 275MFSha3.1]|uniref:DUF4344 domain-containing metallopeptidase n=1 Tax=Methylobacterium sp. 275MFSha3.1 TaxID=1502746 RepID=UPI0008A7A276|nr:DUF4344 domain-containing metallopeptidase [Methylobacterium sp. 275MFSha3.1]SEH92671.1 Putative metallopeptidase [Methylobacterium sp. 275MFSha3.1]